MVAHDARLAAPNSYGSFWDAANRATRLVDARRTVVIANARRDNGGVGATDRRAAVHATVLLHGRGVARADRFGARHFPHLSSG